MARQIKPPRGVFFVSGSGAGNLTIEQVVGDGEYFSFDFELDDYFEYAIENKSLNLAETGVGTIVATTPSLGVFSRSVVESTDGPGLAINVPAGTLFTMLLKVSDKNTVTEDPTTGKISNVDAIVKTVHVKNYAALATQAPPQTNDTIFVVAYGVTLGDGRGGLFEWRTGSTASFDDYTTALDVNVIKSTLAVNGRYHRLNGAFIPAEQADGARQTGSISRTSATGKGLTSFNPVTGLEKIPEVRSYVKGYYATLTALLAEASTFVPNTSGNPATSGAPQSRWLDNEEVIVYGITNNGDLRVPYRLYWIANDTETGAGVLGVTKFRPADISGGNPGRWAMRLPVRGVKLPNSTASPDVASIETAIGPDVAPVGGLTGFTNFRDNKTLKLEPGAVDLLIIPTNGVFETPDRRPYTLYSITNGGQPVFFERENGVIRMVASLPPRLLNAYASKELTIATGAVTPMAGSNTIDTEADAASDDLDNLTATNAKPGDIFILRRENAGRTPTLRHGVGNLRLRNRRNLRLGVAAAAIAFVFDGTLFHDLTPRQDLGFYNVLDYGAVGDNVANDTAAIQQAINDAGAAGGGVVYLPPGRYRVKNPNAPSGVSWNLDRVFSIEANNVQIMGAGYAATSIVNDNASNAHLFVWGNRSSTPTVAVTGGGISNITLDGNEANQDAPDVSVDHWSNVTVEDGCERIVIDSVYSVNAQYYHFGLQRNQVKSCIIRNCWLDGSNADGIDCKNDDGTGIGNIIQNVIVTNFGRSGVLSSQAGIDVRTGVMVTNCVVRNFGANASDDNAFRCQRGNSYFTILQPSQFTNCVAEASTRTGTSGFRLINYQPQLMSCWARNCGQGYHITSEEPSLTNCGASLCNDGFHMRKAFDSIDSVDYACDNGSFTNCLARACVSHGFRTFEASSFNTFLGCHSRGNAYGWTVENDGCAGNKWIGGSITANTTADLNILTGFTANNATYLASGVTGQTTGSYLSGAWTPTLTCATPGNLAVTYTKQEAQYMQLGNQVFIHGTIEASVTHTTASGAAQIVMPFEASTAIQRARGNLSVENLDHSVLTAAQFHIEITNTTDKAQMRYDRDVTNGSSAGTVQITDLVSGATVYRFYFSLIYTRR